MYVLGRVGFLQLNRNPLVLHYITFRVFSARRVPGYDAIKLNLELLGITESQKEIT